jgi:hypothetical protein
MSRSWDIAAELLSVAEDPALISEFAVEAPISTCTTKRAEPLK